MFRTRLARMGIVAVLLGVAAGCCGDRPRLVERFRHRNSTATEVIVPYQGDCCAQSIGPAMISGGCQSCNEGTVVSGPIVEGPVISSPAIQNGVPIFQGAPIMNGPPINQPGSTELLPIPNGNIPPARLEENRAPVTPADPTKGFPLNKTVNQSRF